MRLIALQYHDVVDGHDFDSSGVPGGDANTYKLRRELFEQHVAAITAAHRPTPPMLLGDQTPSVLFTFDDGGVSAAGPTADVLERFGWRGVFLMTTDWIGRPGFLTPSQLRELVERGHVIGAHSCSHPVRFAACTADQMRQEWVESRTRLEDLLGTAVHVASVPGGYYSREVARTAGEAGIQVLFTSEPVVRPHTVSGCRVHGRFTLRTWSSAAYAARLAAGHVVPRVSQWIVWNGKKLAKTVGGAGYLRIRRLLLGGARPESAL